MAEILTAEKHKTITVRRTFNLPLKTVWNAWTEPEIMKKWWGPKGFTCPDCTIDFKVGGNYLTAMQATDLKKIWSTGTYQEIVPLKKIVNTDNFADSKGNIVSASYYNMPGDWGQELLVTTEFEEVNDKTNISVIHTGLPIEMTEECMKGWQSMFDKLESNIK